MKRAFTCLLCLVLLCSVVTTISAQDNHSFQWRYESSAGLPMQNFDVVPLSDNGYLFTGLIDVSSGSAIKNPYIFRTDCKGNILWAKQFSEATEGPGNTIGRLLQLSSTEFVLVSNVGFYFTKPNFDIFMMRFDINGAVKWSQRIGGGTNNQDVVSDAILAADGNILIAGQTGSHGSDSNGNNTYTDQYFLKISPAGAIIWSKTYGNPKAIDRSFAITELSDKSIVAAGSYLHTGGTFFANLLKMDADGKLLWNRAFGEGVAPHANHAYGVLACKDGGFLVTGSSTNVKNNFQDFPDLLILKTDRDGKVVWSRVVAGGAPDSFENAVNSTETENGDFVVTCATASFPTSGFVGNKYAILTISAGGSIKNTTTYNQGSSHYPRLVRNKTEGGYLFTGYTNWMGYGGNGNLFCPLLINTDANFGVNNCFTNDATSVTTVYNPNFEFSNAPATAGSGGSSVNTVTNVSDFEIKFFNLCEKNAYVACSSSLAPDVAVAEKQISVFPNPSLVSLPLTLNWEIKGIVKVELIDAQGRIVGEKSITDTYQKTEFTVAEPGIYTFRLFTSSTFFVKKIVVIQ